MAFSSAWSPVSSFRGIKNFPDKPFGPSQRSLSDPQSSQTDRHLLDQVSLTSFTHGTSFLTLCRQVHQPVMMKYDNEGKSES
jgi:hypothetical protein